LILLKNRFLSPAKKEALIYKKEKLLFIDLLLKNINKT